MWCAERELLYAGGEHGEIYQVSLDGSWQQVASTGGGLVLGLALDADGVLYACDEALGLLLRIDTGSGEVAVHSSGTPQRPAVLPNYPAFLDARTLLVSDSGHWGSDDGVVFAVRADGGTKVWSDRVPGFTNGLAVDHGSRSVYVAESSASVVRRIWLAPDGSADSVTTVFELPGSVPDGLALDGAGNLYVSCYQPDAIFVVTPAGEQRCLVHDWTGQTLSRPTNLAFAGPNLATLVVANVGGQHLSLLHLDDLGLDTRGAEIARPAFRRAG